MQVLQAVAPAGSRVEKAAVVAEFDRQFQQQRLDDYVSAVEQYERSMRSIDAQIDVQRKSFGRNIDAAKGAVEKALLDLKTTPVRSKIEAEQLKLALEESQATLKQYERQVPQQEISLKSQRRSAELDLEQGQIELKRAQRNVDMMRIKAPINGMLAMENTFRGSDFSQIQQGDQLFPGQMFARVVDTSSMLVSATVNQADVEQLRVGAKAVMHFDAYPGLELPAHVISIAAMPLTGGQRASYVKEVSVYLKIDKMDPRVIPDLSVSVDVVLETADAMPVAPIESVFWDAGGDRKPYVYVKSGAGFVKREVELGMANNVRVVVRSGVKPGEAVALERPVQKNNNKQEAASQTAAMWRVPAARAGRESIFGVVNV